MRVAPFVAVLVCVLTCGACGHAQAPTTAAPASNRATASTPAIFTPTATAEPAAATSTPSRPAFPAGYPKVVKVSTLPDQVRSAYEAQSMTEAVAIVPGVWAPKPEGATMQDVFAAGQADGWCASIKSFERKYLGGQQVAGSCW